MIILGLIGGLGLPELLIILVIIMLIFGARRLPEIGSSLGRGIRSFKSAFSGEDEKTRDDNQQADSKAGDDAP